MREIKFRAWDKVNNRMILNNRILKICFVRSNHIPNLIVYSNRNIENRTEIRENDKQYCNEFELMQYTGLKDTNKKEIYEGDILWDEHNEEYCEVIFECGKFVCNFETNSIDLSDISDELIVIGNIYENKELIGDEE